MARWILLASIAACRLVAADIHLKALEFVALNENVEQSLRKRLPVQAGALVTDSDFITMAKTVAAFDPTISFRVAVDEESGEAIVRISGVGQGPAVYAKPPRLIHGVDGILPSGVTPAVGFVPLTILVGTDGLVRKVEDNPVADRPEVKPIFLAAVDAVKQWIYEPATANGVPQETRLVVNVQFPGVYTPIPQPRQQRAVKKQLQL